MTVLRHPLAGCDLDAVRKFPFSGSRRSKPVRGTAGADPALLRDDGLRDHRRQPCHAVLSDGGTLGYPGVHGKVLIDRIAIETFVDRMLGYWIEFFTGYLDAIGDFVEMIWMGDDWGAQAGADPPAAPVPRNLLPRYRQFCSFVKSPRKVKIALHSCGSVRWAMEDFAEAGIDVLHPLQGDAAEMDDPEDLKKRFGTQLAFYSICATRRRFRTAQTGRRPAGVIRKIRPGSRRWICDVGRAQHPGGRVCGKHPGTVRYGARIRGITQSGKRSTW